MADQTQKTQKARLDKGGCKVHGIYLQPTGYTDPPQGSLKRVRYYEVKCPRKDCDFTTWIRMGGLCDCALRKNRATIQKG